MHINSFTQKCLRVPLWHPKELGGHYCDDSIPLLVLCQAPQSGGLSHIMAGDPLGRRVSDTTHIPVAVENNNRCQVCAENHNLYERGHPGTSYANNPFKKVKTSVLYEGCNVYLIAHHHPVGRTGTPRSSTGDELLLELSEGLYIKFL